MRLAFLPLPRRAVTPPAMARPDAAAHPVGPGAAVLRRDSAPNGPVRARPPTTHPQDRRTGPAHMPVFAISPFPARDANYQEGEQA